MIQQAEGLNTQSSLMLIDDADRPGEVVFELSRPRLGHSERRAPCGTQWTVPLRCTG